ncbi:MAG TPA: septum formation initiator family protein [Myxococcota bacterium]|nr:septum formation initiator family protein [Myxococcota bacterium]
MSVWKFLLYRAAPAVVIVLLVAVTVRGEGGLLQYWELQEQAEEARAHWAQLERRNTDLLFGLQQLQADPVQMERLVAEELGYARPGSVLYHFDDGAPLEGEPGAVRAEPSGGGAGPAGEAAGASGE